MNKQEFLEETYNSAFNDELDKIAGPPVGTDRTKVRKRLGLGSKPTRPSVRHAIRSEKRRASASPNYSSMDTSTNIRRKKLD